MSGGRARSRRFAAGLLLIGASLALFIVLVVVGLDPAPEPTLGADGYSISGLGHSALLALLAEHGVPVAQSRWSSALRAGDEHALVIAEPEPGLESTGGRPPLAQALEQARRLLVVAPKRTELGPARERPRWMSEQRPLGLGEVQEALEGLGVRVRRAAGGPEPWGWEVPEGWPTPTLEEPVQLFAPHDDLEPIVSLRDGVLLGRLTGRRLRGAEGERDVLVLADPDVLANHGLVKDGNADFALRLLRRLWDGRGSVLWDETWHGHRSEARVGRILLAPPLGYLTASLGLLALLALWAGAVRFGGARPPRPPIEPGKAFLVSNTADLLRAGGHTGHALRHYVDASERELAEALHAGRGDARSARAGLEALAQARGLRGPTALHAEVEALLARRHPEPAALLAAADRIHRWKEELLHGRRRDS